MNDFLLTIAAVLLAVIFILVLKKGEPGFGQLLSILVCAGVLILALRSVEPVISFVENIQNIIGINSDLVKVLLKSVGISVTAEIVELICIDSGNAAMGKAVQIFAGIIIVCMSIPLLNGLMELIGEVLGSL